MQAYGSRKWRSQHGYSQCHICGETYDTKVQQRKRARREAKREIESQRRDGLND